MKKRTYHSDISAERMSDGIDVTYLCDDCFEGDAEDDDYSDHEDKTQDVECQACGTTYLEELSLQEEFTSWKLAPKQIDEIMTYASIADNEARSDLVRGYISDENGYTSTFTSALRRIINTSSKSGISATSYVLQPRDERVSGCDAIIQISHGRYSKFAVFEAKHPRFSEKKYKWDYPQTASSGISHFSHQLKKQEKLSSKIARFEMFYVDLESGYQPNHLQEIGSSCVWFQHAYDFMLKRSNPEKIWNRVELDEMLTGSNVPISMVLHEVCICNEGEAISDGLIEEFLVWELGLSGLVLKLSCETNEASI